MHGHDLSSYLMLLCLCLAGCSGAQSPELCFLGKQKDIEATRVATLVHRCREYPSVDVCPYTEGIDEKYDRKIDAAKEACLNGAP
jgi:hypothetical protein